MRPLTTEELFKVAGGTTDVIVVTGTPLPPPPPPGGVDWWGGSDHWLDHDSGDRDNEGGGDNPETSELTEEELEALTLLNQLQQLTAASLEDLKASAAFVKLGDAFYHIDDVIKASKIAGNLATALEIGYHLEQGDYVTASTALVSAIGATLVGAGVTAVTASAVAGAGAAIVTGFAITGAVVGTGFVVSATIDAYNNIPPPPWTEGDGTPQENYNNWWNDYFGIPNIPNLHPHWSIESATGIRSARRRWRS